MACEEINDQLINLKIRIEGLAERFLGAQRCNEVKEFANNHPCVLGTVFLTLVFSAIPIIFFLCFAVITALIALICFICVEGFLLIIGGLLLAGVVSFIIILTSGVTVFFSIAFWFVQKFHRLFCVYVHQQVPAHPRIETQNAETQNADSSDT